MKLNYVDSQKDPSDGDHRAVAAPGILFSMEVRTIVLKAWQARKGQVYLKTLRSGKNSSLLHSSVTKLTYLFSHAFFFRSMPEKYWFQGR